MHLDAIRELVVAKVCPGSLMRSQLRLPEEVNQ